jgi:hypothetical protein
MKRLSKREIEREVSKLEERVSASEGEQDHSDLTLPAETIRALIDAAEYRLQNPGEPLPDGVDVPPIFEGFFEEATDDDLREIVQKRGER